jgi:hypothetical protein
MPLSIDPPLPSIDDDLNQIERDIRTLKIEYEQFFGGGRKRPPADTQWRVDSTIRRVSERTGDQNFNQRFRLNNLLQTYAKYQDMWRKKLVQKESGSPHRHFGAAAKAIEAERARRAALGEPPHAPEAPHEKKPGRVAVCAFQFDLRPEPTSPGGDARLAGERGKIEELYRRLIEARTETGEKTGAPSMRDFERFVEQKTQELQAKGAHQIEYTVSIEAGRVKLKARVLN